MFLLPLMAALREERKVVFAALPNRWSALMEFRSDSTSFSSTVLESIWRGTPPDSLKLASGADTAFWMVKNCGTIVLANTTSVNFKMRTPLLRSKSNESRTGVSSLSGTADAWTAVVLLTVRATLPLRSTTAGADKLTKVALRVSTRGALKRMFE